LAVFVSVVIAAAVEDMAQYDKIKGGGIIFMDAKHLRDEASNLRIRAQKARDEASREMQSASGYSDRGDTAQAQRERDKANTFNVQAQKDDEEAGNMEQQAQVKESQAIDLEKQQSQVRADMENKINDLEKQKRKLVDNTTGGLF
jgi:hypothetical protein